MKKYVFIFFLIAVYSQIILAQDTDESQVASSSDAALKNAINLYEKAIGRNSRIYNGTYYFDRNLGIIGHPFYEENFWEIGSITYEGHRYDSIEIRYDVYSDLVLVKYIDPEGFVTPIELNSVKIDEFDSRGHHFIRLEEDTVSGIRTGFYDLLYDGQIAQALAKRRKEISHLNTSGNQVKEYVVKDRYYIKTGASYNLVKGKKAILEVLSDRNNDIKAYLKKNRGRFRKNFEKLLTETVKYYNNMLENQVL